MQPRRALNLPKGWAPSDDEMQQRVRGLRC